MSKQQVDIERDFKVLCIDDDPEVSRALELRLRNIGVTVLRAFHGTHGLWLAKNERPSVIITDVNMPQGQGDYVVECLKSDPETCKIPVVVLSGLHKDELSRRLSDMDVEACFAKPCEIGALVSQIHSYIKGTEDNQFPNQNAEQGIIAP